MTFQDFTFPQVLKTLGLTFDNRKLLLHIREWNPAPEFTAQVLDGANLASAIGTQKARSEFIVAPILLEIWHAHDAKFRLFSGLDLNAEPTRGLSGECDFIVTKSSSWLFPEPPFVMIVEGRREDLRSGFGPCIASMVAAQMMNQATAPDAKPKTVFGVVTTGMAWNFFVLEGQTITVDLVEYSVHSLGKIIGILDHIIHSA